MGQFLSLAMQFCIQLQNHHDAEERRFFPMLAKNMPMFKKQTPVVEVSNEEQWRMQKSAGGPPAPKYHEYPPTPATPHDQYPPQNKFGPQPEISHELPASAYPVRYEVPG